MEHREEIKQHHHISHSHNYHHDMHGHHHEPHEKRAERQRIATYCIVLFLVFLTVLIIGVLRQMQEQTNAIQEVIYENTQ